MKRAPWVALNVAIAVAGLLCLLVILGYCGVAVAR